MMAWRTLVAAAMALGLGGCGIADDDQKDWFRPIRYRLTATVETPAGERSGFSVIEAQTDRSITRVRARGEAVAVDLPDGQVLFVLLRSPTLEDWAASLPGIPSPEKDVEAHGFAERQAQLEREFDAMSRDYDVHYLWRAGVPRDQAKDLPYMVRFRDIADPNSVELVRPGDLSESFGSGLKLKSLTIQVTDAPVTTGIEKRLGWLAGVGRQRATLIERPKRKPGAGLPLLKDATPIQLIRPTDFELR